MCETRHNDIRIDDTTTIFEDTTHLVSMASQDPLSSLEGDQLDIAPGAKQSKGDIVAADHIERLPNVANGSPITEPTDGQDDKVQKCDVLVVGAGFSKARLDI